MKKNIFLLSGFLCFYLVGYSQNVGIGNNNPTRGVLEITGNSTYSNLAVTNVGATAGMSLNSSELGFNFYRSSGIKQYANGYAGAINFSSGKMRFYTSNSEVNAGGIPSGLFSGSAAITIDSNRNVGIGSEFPSNFNARLLVSKNSTLDGPQMTIYESASSNYARLELRSAQANNPQRFWHVVGLNATGAASGDRFNIYHSVAGDMISLLGDGRVGIGGINSHATGYKLSVRGKIMCEEVRVQLYAAWPDYVFDNAYPLRSLPELEKFILNNKHLPGIPKAATIEKDGLDMGDMQKRMMEKIEELTLYIIQQQKEIEALKAADKN